MSRGLLLAALVEAGIISWRDLSEDKILPLPSDFTAVVIFYGGLSLLPGAASSFASLVGWGMVVATWFNVWNPANPTRLVLPGQTPQKAPPPGSTTPTAAKLGQPGNITTTTINPTTGLPVGISKTGGASQSIHP